MVQITENPYLGKPLRGILKGKRRVHTGHFVFIYKGVFEMGSAYITLFLKRKAYQSTFLPSVKNFTFLSTGSFVRKKV